MAGIVGAIKYNKETNPYAVSEDLYFILSHVQNRGQASAKIITLMNNCQESYSNKQVSHELLSYGNKNLLFSELKVNGLVKDLINEGLLKKTFGNRGVAAVSNEPSNNSFSLPKRYEGISLCKDGYLSNDNEIKNHLIDKGFYLSKRSAGAEVFAKLFFYHYQQTCLEDRLKRSGVEAMRRCVDGFEEMPPIKGGFSTIAMTPLSLIAYVNNIKPLGYMITDDSVLISSESTGPFTLVSEVNSDNFADYWHDLKPGEIVEFKLNREVKTLNLNRENCKICAFEWAYFAMPPCVIHGLEVADVRDKVGAALSRLVRANIESNSFSVNNCVIAPALDSGMYYGQGLSRELKIPFQTLLEKDKYALKSFILNTQKNRVKEVRSKHLPSPTRLKGKEVILTEDSIVRGTTMRGMVDLIKNKGGARVVHVVPGFPEKRYYCPFVPPESDKLMAEGTSVEDMRVMLGADTLTFGTLEIWHKILGEDKCYECVKQDKV